MARKKMPDDVVWRIGQVAAEGARELFTQKGRGMAAEREAQIKESIRQTRANLESIATHASNIPGKGTREDNLKALRKQVPYPWRHRIR